MVEFDLTPEEFKEFKKRYYKALFNQKEYFMF